MIELVLESETIGKIHKIFGGGAQGAFKENTIYDYLKV
jgi:hypothetical protein